MISSSTTTIEKRQRLPHLGNPYVLRPVCGGQQPTALEIHHSGYRHGCVTEKVLQRHGWVGERRRISVSAFVAYHENLNPRRFIVKREAKTTVISHKQGYTTITNSNTNPTPPNSYQTPLMGRLLLFR